MLKMHMDMATQPTLSDLLDARRQQLFAVAHEMAEKQKRTKYVSARMPKQPTELELAKQRVERIRRIGTGRR